MPLALPPGSVTGVGSLPFGDPDGALRFVARHSPVLPFWPQLPGRHPREGVIPQALGALARFLEPGPDPRWWQVRAGRERALFAALDTDEACLLPETAAGFFAFEAACRAGRFPAAAAVKAQTEGPATLAHALLAGGRPLACRPGWLSRLTSFVARQAVWQVGRLQGLGKPVVVVVDEPALGLAALGAPPAQGWAMVAAVDRVLRAVRRAGAVAGLHCCTPLPVALIAALDPDLLSFDAHLPSGGDRWLDVARTVIARPGSLAFGLVPTDPGRHVDAPGPLALWLRLAALAEDVTAVARRTIVTATCGLGLATADGAAVAFERCREVGGAIAELAGGARA
jgi:hypothetical protein